MSFDFVELEFEVKSKVLKQMDYIEANEEGGGWIEKPKEGEGTIIAATVEEKLMNPFELMMMAKMDELKRMHKKDYGEMKESFETISKRLDAMRATHVDDLLFFP